jgi:hypothetical protein
VIDRVSRAVVAPLLAVLLLAGCQDDPEAPPRPVPTALAPKAVLGGSLGLYLNTSAGTEAAFKQDAEDALIDEGKLWEVRRKDRLVGTLQIATVKPDIDLSKDDVRRQFTSPILVGSRSDIRLLGQEVNVVEGEGGLSTLVWFGDGLFLVLQVKDKLVTGPDLAQAILEHQQSRPEWVPLPELYSPT